MVEATEFQATGVRLGLDTKEQETDYAESGGYCQRNGQDPRHPEMGPGIRVVDMESTSKTTVDWDEEVDWWEDFTPKSERREKRKSSRQKMKVDGRGILTIQEALQNRVRRRGKNGQ